MERIICLPAKLVLLPAQSIPMVKDSNLEHPIDMAALAEATC